MATTKRIVILANSKKHLGSCIAGVELATGNWIRPVSDRPDEEVSADEQRLVDGMFPRPLDVVDVPLLTPHPVGHQPENWRLDPQGKWTKIGTAAWSDLSEWATDAPLWSNREHTFDGTNDVVSPKYIVTAEGSLRIFPLDRLEIRVFVPGARFGRTRRRILGSFTHAAESYALWVTDSEIRQTYLAQPDGVHHIGRCYLTVSLGELFGGRHSKLIAAVIGEPRP